MRGRLLIILLIFSVPLLREGWAVVPSVLLPTHRELAEAEALSRQATHRMKPYVREVQKLNDLALQHVHEKLAEARQTLATLSPKKHEHGLYHTRGLSHKDHPTVFIFVSFTIPRPIFETLVRQAKQVGAVVVLRGLYHDNWRTTLLKIKELTEHNKGGVIIDPPLFKQFHITAVPTFVEVPKGYVFCSTKECLKQDVAYNKMRGNVSLPYALKILRGEVTL